MAEVRPLRGLRYVPERVEGLAQVITPPYDIISPDDQARYYARSAYNIIRLELGRSNPEDNALNNVYTRAAATLSEWRLQNIVRQDTEAAYYLYQQIFSYGTQVYRRTSILARVRVEPWSTRVILPHEHTLAKAKNDRLQLYRATATNFSPIMSLYDDPQGRMRRLLSSYVPESEVQVTDESGIEHRLHPITNQEHQRLIQDFFAQRQLYIADGHHRYETAQAYRKELLEQRKELHPDDAANFTLMALIDLDDPGMLVLPTHRILFGLSEDTLAQLASPQLADYFTVQSVERTSSERLPSLLAKAGKERPSLLVHSQHATLLLSLNEQGQQYMSESPHSAAWKALDVAIAQRILLEKLLGLTDQDMTAGTHIRYSHDWDEAFAVVQRKEAQATIFLNGTPLRQISAVAQADDRMPQKSTYIYPKLITGLVMNPLW